MTTSRAVTFAAAACAAALAVTSIASAAQRRDTTAAGGSSATAAPASPSSNATANQYIEETSFMLKRADIDAHLKALPKAPAPAAAPKKKGLGGLTDSIKSAVSGDDRREEAAMHLVEDLALAASANNSKTVVVVIGNDGDREKVKTSMSSVHRHVVLALLDKGVKDSTYDNSAIGSGFTDQLKGAASNVLVFLPRPNQKSHRADETLSTRVMTEKIWTGLFAADGDAPAEVTGLANRAPGGSSAPEARGTSGSTPATAAPTTPAGPGTFAVGDVVRPKIANVKVMAQPSDSAKALATLAKTDELVVTGAEKDGFTSVQGSSTSGWVKTVMLAKP